jgi:sugar lactone lactonase YvrE
VESLTISGLTRVAEGVERPEDVLSLPDGRVLASDSSSAVAQILPDGSHVRLGQAGGTPNGIALLPSGKIAVANFHLGCLQVLDLDSGTIDMLADRTDDGTPLRYANYPLADRSGGVWLSCCTTDVDIPTALATPRPHGMIAYVTPDGQARLVVRETFPNCMAFDHGGTHLYVARTATTDVVRYEVLGPGMLGRPESFGPPLGGRRADEVGDAYIGVARDADTARRWGFADGCSFDALGNLWVTLVMADAIVAVSPDGRVVPVRVHDAETVVAPTSVCWAGEDMRDIYIGSLAAPYVLRGRSSVPGRARYPSPA